MNPAARYVLFVIATIISLHFILTFSHPGYSRATSLRNYEPYTSSESPYYQTASLNSTGTCSPDYNLTSFYHTRRANATFIMLARNFDLDGVAKTVRDIEDRFNRKYNYPYVFLNDEPFNDEFKRRISILSDAKMEFGTIPKEHWVQPDWIDEKKATEERDKMVDEGVLYGGSISYRNMCRFNSGFFFKHPLVEQYRWYWRIEPDVQYTCDIDFDPFLYLQDHDKVYGFTITLYEFVKTIPTLWNHVREFMKLYPQHVQEGNAMGWMSHNGGKTYNGCHFWSNFEIADMDFWRGPAYQAFFEYLDRQGGFYYERWGDAPVHSIAVGLLARKDQIHFFENIGYEHYPNQHCPKDEKIWKRARCSCNPSTSIDDDRRNSCLNLWHRIW